PATGAQTSAATPSQASASNPPATGAQTSAATPSLQNNTTSVSSSEHTPSQANVTLINNTSDFKEIATSTQTLAGRYKLTQDLDISDVSPIGNKTNPFTGKFNGSGHTIKTNHSVFGRVDGGEVSNITIEDSHLECNPDAYAPYCRESLLIDELTGNSTVTNNTIQNSSVTCNYGSTCSALINRMEINPVKEVTPRLEGNRIIGSNITVNEVRATDTNLASVGVAQVDIVVKDGENQLTAGQLKNLPPPHISGIYSDNNTISGNPEPVNGGITLGSVRYIVKSYTTTEKYTEAGFIPNGTEKIHVHKIDLPTSDNPANSWAKLILDKPSTCNTSMNGEIFNQNCPQQSVCPTISPALPPTATPDANSTQPEIVPVVPLPCPFPWWLLPVGIGIGVIGTAAACWSICRSRSRAKEEAPIELMNISNALTEKGCQTSSQTLSIETETLHSGASSSTFINTGQAAMEVENSSTSSILSAKVPPLEPMQLEPMQLEPMQLEPMQLEPMQLEPMQLEPMQLDPMQQPTIEEQLQSLKGGFIKLKQQLKEVDELTAYNSPLDDTLQQSIHAFAKETDNKLTPLHPQPYWRDSVNFTLTHLASKPLQQGTFISDSDALIEKCLELIDHSEGKYNLQPLRTTLRELSKLTEQVIGNIHQNQNSPDLEDECLPLLNLGGLSITSSTSSGFPEPSTPLFHYESSTDVDELSSTNSQGSSLLLDDRHEPAQMQNDIDKLRQQLQSLRSQDSLTLTPGNESAHQKREAHKIRLCQAVKDLQEQQERDLPAPEYLDTIAEELNSTQPKTPILTTLDTLLDSLQSFITKSPQPDRITMPYISNVLTRMRGLIENLSGQEKATHIELETDLSGQKMQYASQGGEKGQHMQSYLEDLIPLATQLKDIENNPELSSDEIMKFVSEASQRITRLETNYLKKEQHASDSELQADTKAINTIESMTARIEALVQRAELLRQEISPESHPLEVPEELIAFRERLGRVRRLANLFEEQDKRGVPKLDPAIRRSILAGSTASLYEKLQYDDDPLTSDNGTIQVKSEYS
ncbi:hypothetical protein, partial [Endozoicomonas ascidiicola]|uniref:hypothetical protein n=1 Tax=Endozoicomonas ascidiicola TaxID=1698521 RepID=UPI001C12AB19